MTNLQIREDLVSSIISSKMSLIKTIVNDKAKASIYASALKSISSDYNLRDCSVDSIIEVGLSIIQAGLNPNKLFGQAYVVPFKLKNGGTTAQFQIGYKGWIALGYRNGWKFKAVAVYKCDDFSIEFGGFEDKINFNPNYEARNDDDGNWVFNNLRGVIVYAKDSVGDTWTEFVSFKKLEKLRLKSQNQNSKTALSNIWLEWAEEMYKAKSLKYVITRLPINDSIMEVVAKEDEVFSIKARATQRTNPIIDLNAVIDQTSAPTKQIEKQKNHYQDWFYNELISNGVYETRAKVEVNSYSDEQIEALMNDPSALEDIINQAKD